jgi:hypothetical protein
MSLTLKPATPRLLKNAVTPGPFSGRTFARVLHLIFITGPRLMFTRRLSVKSASMMIMLCVSALLFCTMMTVPAFLFPDPEQHAYFQFSQVLNHDPIRWIGLMLAGTCAIIALAVPAATPDPYTSVRY